MAWDDIETATDAIDLVRDYDRFTGTSTSDAYVDWGNAAAQQTVDRFDLETNPSDVTVISVGHDARSAAAMLFYGADCVQKGDLVIRPDGAVIIIERQRFSTQTEPRAMTIIRHEMAHVEAGFVDGWCGERCTTFERIRDEMCAARVLGDQSRALEAAKGEGKEPEPTGHWPTGQLQKPAEDHVGPTVIKPTIKPVEIDREK